MRQSFALTLFSTACAVARPHALNGSWSGWKNVKYMVVFGDSYTQTGFSVNGTQPSPSNPMGNPPYPGWTSSNGPNWVDFLTYTYNESLIQTYNLAYGGATVDSALVAPYQPTVLSMKDQVENEYLPTYAKNSSSAPWDSHNSLFAFFIGINDVGNSWWLNNSTLIDDIFAVYTGLLDKVYATGARNFLFLTVPPVNLAPLTLANGDSAIQGEGAAIQNWNSRLQNTTTQWRNSKKDQPTVFVHDTWGAFSTVLKNVTAFPQTSGIKNTTGYCTAYENGTPTWYTLDANCTYPVNEYFWLNTLHPTFPMHNATAASIVQYLNKAAPN